MPVRKSREENKCPMRLPTDRCSYFVTLQENPPTHKGMPCQRGPGSLIPETVFCLAVDATNTPRARWSRAARGSLTRPLRRNAQHGCHHADGNSHRNAQDAARGPPER